MYIQERKRVRVREKREREKKKERKRKKDWLFSEFYLAFFLEIEREEPKS